MKFWNLKSRREGSALLIALLALAGLSILGLSLMLVTDTELQVSNDERLRKQALYAAEAGIEHALMYLRSVKNEAYGYNAGMAGLLSGDVIANSNQAPSDPAPEDQSYDDPIVITENVWNAATPWKAPALARKGKILFFCGASCPAWWDAAGSKPTTNYSMRDIPFEKSAGAAMGAFDVGTFKSRYTVYVKNNYDDPAVFLGTTSCLPIPPPQGSSNYECDEDATVVLTSEGIVDVLAGVTGRGGVGGLGYKVVRTLEMTIRNKPPNLCRGYGMAQGEQLAGNSMFDCEKDFPPMTDPTKIDATRNTNW